MFKVNSVCIILVLNRQLGNSWIEPIKSKCSVDATAYEAELAKCQKQLIILPGGNYGRRTKSGEVTHLSNHLNKSIEIPAVAVSEIG